MTEYICNTKEEFHEAVRKAKRGNGDIMTFNDSTFDYMINHLKMKEVDDSPDICDWNICCDALPNEEEVVLCYCPEITSFMRGVSSSSCDYSLGRLREGCWRRIDNSNITVYSWMRFSKPKTPSSERLNKIFCMYCRKALIPYRHPFTRHPEGYCCIPCQTVGRDGLQIKKLEERISKLEGEGVDNE